MSDNVPDRPPHEAYEPIADLYAAATDDPQLREQIRLMFCDAIHGTRVLEIGCGPGHDAAALATAGLNVTAVDLCESFLTHGRRRYPRVAFHCRDILSLGFPEASFDGIIGMACLCHIKDADLQTALSSIRSCLAPEGVVMIWLMDSPSVSSYHVDDWGGLEGNNIEMICHSRQRFRDHLSTAGFTGITVTPVQSDFYAAIPRIRENNIEQYLVQARLPLSQRPRSPKPPRSRQR